MINYRLSCQNNYIVNNEYELEMLQSKKATEKVNIDKRGRFSEFISAFIKIIRLH